MSLTAAQVKTQIRTAEIAAAFDAAISGRVKSGQRTTTVEPAEMTAIIETALRNGQVVTEQERKDMEIITAYASIAADAKTKLSDFLTKRAAEFAKFNARPATPQQLKHMTDALTDKRYTGYATFTSPVTNHAYHAGMFGTIAGLITAGHIRCYTYELGDTDEQEAIQKRSGGLYHSSANELWVNLASLRDAKFGVSVIVHEALHAIQDFKNMGMKGKYLECDAYICQCLTYLGRGDEASISPRNALLTAARAPAREVYEHLTKTPKPPTLKYKTYEALAAAIKADPLYAARAEQPRNAAGSPGDADETAKWDAMKNALAKGKK